MKNKVFIFSILISLLFVGSGTQAVRAADEPPDPRIAIYVIPPIADEKILPTTAIPDGYISNEIYIVACPGEYEPSSFVIHALDDIASLQVAATELEGESDSIPSPAPPPEITEKIIQDESVTSAEILSKELDEKIQQPAESEQAGSLMPDWLSEIDSGDEIPAARGESSAKTKLEAKIYDISVDLPNVISFI